MENKIKRAENPNIAAVKQVMFNLDCSMSTTNANKTSTTYRAKSVKHLVAEGHSKEEARALRKEYRQEFSDKVKEGLGEILPLVEITSQRMGAKGNGGISWRPIVQRIAKVKMSDADIIKYMLAHPELVAQLKSAKPAQPKA